MPKAPAGKALFALYSDIFLTLWWVLCIFKKISEAEHGYSVMHPARDIYLYVMIF